MPDDYTPTLQDMAVDREWRSADAARHYRELAHLLRQSAARSRLPSSQQELLDLARLYDARADCLSIEMPDHWQPARPTVGLYRDAASRETDGNPVTVREYVLKLLDEGERNLNVLVRQTRIQFLSSARRINASYVRRLRNEWQRSSAAHDVT
jgi:hypothetical protein